MTTSTQHFVDPAQVHERRLYPRVLPKSLIYVACGEANGGMVLNASDDGLAISMAIAVGDESFSNLHVRMNGLPGSIEVHGRMVWTTKTKKRAGIQLVDLDQNQREQIREWLALEGVRDVNLLPRVVLENNASRQPQLSVGAVSSTIFAEPRSSLLDAFGGSAPESLGPITQGVFSSEGVSGETEPSQGFDILNPPGFRESEWDLAAVAMIPRKKARPEGLSALGLTLLWIAIPTFGMGILVARRPLVQWLYRGDTVGKSISRVATPGNEAVSRGPLPAAQGVDAIEGEPGPQPTGPISADIPSAASSLVSKSAEESKPAEISARIVDARLLNSISTQEARARIHSIAVGAKEITPNAIPKVDSNLDSNLNRPDRGSIPSESVKIKPASPVPVAGTPGDKPEIPSGLVARSLSETNSSGQVSKTLSVDSGLDSVGAKNPTAASSPPSASNVTPSTAATRNAPAAAVSTPATSAATVTSTPQTNRGSAPGSRTISSTQAVTTPPPATGISYPPASAPGGSNMAGGTSKIPPVSMPASNAVPMGTPSASPRPVAPVVTPSLAPTTTQQPIHGVLLVARKSDETFLLKLPVESVAGAPSAAIRMQRSVMVPPQSRWHRRGPIAKLTVGELITHVAPDQSDAGIKPRPGEVVSVRAFVGKDGNVLDLKPTTGRFALMPRVMRAVRDWQYEPTLLDGKPVESEVNVTVEFRPIH